MKFKTPYNGMTSRHSLEFSEPSLTDQSFKDECDLNYIIKMCVKTGQVPQQGGQYGDFSSVQEFQDAMYVVANAKSQFEMLPSALRDKYGSVEGMLDFVSKEENLKTSIDDGLIAAESVPMDKLMTLYPEKFDVQVDNLVVPGKVPQSTAAAGAEPVNSSSPAATAPTTTS